MVVSKMNRASGLRNLQYSVNTKTTTYIRVRESKVMLNELGDILWGWSERQSFSDLKSGVEFITFLPVCLSPI